MMTQPKNHRVAVLYGGKSAEHDVSVNSGMIAVEHLRESFAVLPVYLNRDGRWLMAEDAEDALAAARALPSRPAAGSSAGHGLAALEERAVRAVFLALHGPFGEDGRLQGLLETAGIPYTGSGVLGSAMAMDKDIAKRLYAQAGLPIAASRTLVRGELERKKELLDSIVAELGMPLVVKPVAQGSSVGTMVCREPGTLSEAVHEALEHGASVLLEQFVSGRELTCGVLELDAEGTRCALPPTLIRPRRAEFFDYKAKYQTGETEEITPAPIDPELTGRVQDIALAAHAALKLRGYSRTDLIESGGELYVLETNTLPGLTQTSLFPQAAAAAGIPLARLLCHLVCIAAALPSPLDIAALQHCRQTGA
jgi:D-alanine-D-alanine ligase